MHETSEACGKSRRRAPMTFVREDFVQRAESESALETEIGLLVAGRQGSALSFFSLQGAPERVDFFTQ